MTTKVPTRDRFLQAARLLFWQHGYRAVSVDDICKRAKGMKGSFYHFFPSKEKLLVAVLEEVWLEEWESLNHIHNLPVPMIERLHMFIERQVKIQRDAYQEHGEVLGGVYQALNAGLPPAVLEQIRRMALAFKTVMIEMFTTLANDGLMAHESVPLKVRGFGYIISGALMDARIMGNIDALNNLADYTLQLLGLRSVTARRPAGPEADLAAVPEPSAVRAGS